LLWLVPITADIFVFFYPVLLVILYLIWIFQKKRYYKESALWIFWAWVFSIFFNIFLQHFCDKIRPNILLWLRWDKVETVLHQFLPQSSFPSDHSALSVAIAMWIILWGIRNKDKKFIWIWSIFLILGLLMWLSRIMIIVHRPTDVIAWFAVGALIPIILFQKSIYKIFKKILITPLINLQEWVFWLFGVKY
jgi:membrane-associated phospholipid phosphatase